MIDEEEVLREFEKALSEALTLYEGKEITYEALNVFIEDRVWDSLVKYNRMQLVTKEKFFESLYKRTSVDEYTKGIIELWDIDHGYMDEAIKELQKMVIQKDFREAELYGNKKITERSIKLENTWREFNLTEEELYTLTPGRDFRTLEQRYVNRHIKLYENMLKRLKTIEEIADFVKKYDDLDKTIPYFSHTTGEIVRYVDLSTYLSMLYNVNLTRSAWNRAIYDAKLLGNHLWYLPPHPFACPGCMFFQGYVYTDHTPTPREVNILREYGKPGYERKEDTYGENPNSDIGIGHPNCKHVWTLYFSQEQIQKEKYDSEEWAEKYKNKQKIQSLDLKKSRLLTDRRIYKELGQQDLVDKTTEKIKRIREQKKKLEDLS